MENIEVIEKKNKRLQNFTTELKNILAAQTRQHPRIWDVTDKLHSRKDAVEQAWMEISEVVQRPANECKSVWSSMRESYRYQTKVSRKAKRGDPGEEALDEPYLENENLEDVAKRACEDINAYLLRTIDEERQKKN